MSSHRDIREIIESGPDGWVFAAIDGDSAEGRMKDRGNYQSEVGCLAILILELNQQTHASIDKIAYDAVRLAKKNKDAPRFVTKG